MNITPKELYAFWNSRYFKGRLPDIPVKWSYRLYVSSAQKSKMGSTWFDCETHKPLRITLNPKYRDAPSLWYATLLHEMVHVQHWRTPNEQAHGQKFQRRMKQLAVAGAFKNLW